MEDLQNEEFTEQSIEEDRRWCVYMHTCKANNKVYIGITNNVKHRWRNRGGSYKEKDKDGHYKQGAFANALKTYSDWDNDWIHEILFSELSYDEACQKEVELIELYHSNISRWHDEAMGYNMTDGGQGVMHNNKHSNETKRKISEQAKERLSNPKNNPMYGKKQSEESKRKNREAHIGKNAGPNSTKAKPLYCPELNQLFWGGVEVEKILGIDNSDVSKCAQGKKDFAGKHPITGEKLTWKYIYNNTNNNK